MVNQIRLKALNLNFMPWLLRCFAPAFTILANIFISSSVTPEHYAKIVYFVTIYTLVGSSLFGGISSASLRFLNNTSPLIQVYADLKSRNFRLISIYTGINIFLAFIVPFILSYPNPLYLTIAIIGAGLVAISCNIERANNRLFQMATNLNIYAISRVLIFVASLSSFIPEKLELVNQIKLTSLLILLLGLVMLYIAIANIMKNNLSHPIEYVSPQEQNILFKYMKSTQIYQFLVNISELSMPLVLFNAIGPTIYAYFALAENIILKPMAFLGSNINVYLSNIIYRNYDQDQSIRPVKQERVITLIYLPLSLLAYLFFIIFCLSTKYALILDSLWLPTVILMLCPVATYFQHRCTQRLSALRRVDRLIPISVSGSLTQLLFIAIFYALGTLNYLTLSLSMLMSCIVMAILACIYLKNTSDVIFKTNL